MRSKNLFLCLLAAMLTISSCNEAIADTYTLVGGEVEGQDPIAIGAGSSAQHHYDISLGVNAVSNGYAYHSSETPAIAIGYNAEAVGAGFIAIGNGATATSEANTRLKTGNIAIGDGAQATGLYQSLAVGDSAAAGGQDTAIGALSKASGGQSVAFGWQAEATESNSVAIGAMSKAQGLRSTALGRDAKAVENYTTALGYYARATDVGNVSVGANSEARTSRSVALGYEAKAYGASSIAIGSGTIAGQGEADDSGKWVSSSGSATAIGSFAKAYGTDSTAVGVSAVVSEGVTNSVAIGHGSRANEDNVVSVGTSINRGYRRIVNLDEGINGTDAVNVNQLKDLSELLGGSTLTDGQWDEKFAVDGTEYDSVADAISSLAGGSDNAVLYDGDDKSAVTLRGTNGTKITNLAAGVNDTDAVNFKQLSAVSEEAKNKGSWTLNAGESANVIGDGDSITIAEGSNLKITAEGGTYTFGVVDNPEFASVKIGDYTISHNNGLDMGGAVLDNVAAGSIASGSMQTVNGGQLFTTNTNLSNLGGSVANAFGGAWNYEDGALSGEFTYNGSGTTLQGALDSISAKLDELSEGWYFEANDGGASGEAGTGAGESQIKPGDKLTVNAGDDINITQNGDKDYTISVDPNLKEEIKDGYTTADNILKEEITDDYTTADNILKEQIKNDYTTADNVLKEQIENDYTTADNVLKEEITDAYTNADNVMKEEITDAYTTADNVLKEQIKDDYTTADNVLKEQIKNDYTTADNIVREEFKAADSELRADIDKSAATIEEIGGVLGGAENGYMTPTFNSVTANSLTMGNYTMSATNSGFDMGGARLSGIADGGIYRGSSDAVTGNQLWEAYNRMDDLGERINVVGAHAAALSGLHPIDYNPYEPTTLSAAVGTYRDEYAVAVGVFHYTRENVMFNLGASLCSDGDIMGRAGVSFTVGKSPDKPKVAGTMNGLRNQVIAMQAKLDELEARDKQSKAEQAKLADENRQNREIIKKNAEIMKQNEKLIRELTKKLEAQK